MYRLLTVTIALMVVSSAPAEPIVSNTYENLSATRTLVNTPVTFSRIGAAGDFVKGVTPSINGAKLPAQVDVLRKAPDGSIRHALVSFRLPKLAAGGKVTVDWLNEKPADPPALKWPDDVKATLVLTPEEGAPVTSVLTMMSDTPRIKVLYDGPVMKEFEVHGIPVDAEGKPSRHIEVFWRLRAFTGEKSVRIACVVERCKDRTKPKAEPIQYKFKSVKLTVGGKTLYEAGPFDHLDQTRYRILVWSAGAVEDIHRRPNYAYWQKGKFVPRYRWSGKPRSPKAVDAFYAKRQPMSVHPRRPQGMLESGIILRHMPNTGGRWDLGPYPSWVQAYLLAGGGPKTYRAILHADGNGGGAFFIHVRQDGMPGYNIFTVKQPAQDKGFRLPLYRLPDGSKPAAQPDHAHAPSIGYIAYLLTGDKYYADETSFWAAYHCGEWPHKGLKWRGMDRSFSWSFRQTVDAAYILPDNHPLLPFFRKAINKCIDEMTNRYVKSDRRVHSPDTGNFQCSGRQNWVNAMRCSAWMYAWCVWAFGNAAEKDFPKAAACRDWSAGFIVGLYTSDDEFKAPDGKTYKIDPRDAMPYSTAIALLPTKIVKLKNGKDGVKLTAWKPEQFENFAAIWYYTKLNVDNGWYDQRGLEFLPDDKGVWPLRPIGKGFGAGKMWWAWARKCSPHFNYHMEASTGMSMACDAGIPKAKDAWKLMMKFGAKRGEYGINIIPRCDGDW